MARQRGILPIEGTLGNITFFKSKDGYMAREKGGVSANRIANDPAFQRTRENNAEFGRAGKASKVLRTALRVMLQKASDSRVVGRLTSEMVKVIQLDTVNVRGLRNVIDGEAELLQGFEFNAQGKLSTTLYTPYTAVLNRTTGAASVTLEDFVPANMITSPAGSTHFKLLMAAASIDFEQETYEVEATETTYHAIDSTVLTLPALTVSLTASSTHPLFLALGIEFVQQVNTRYYPLKNGAFNACSLIKVDGGV